ncbi:hypothetical protein ONZ51_g6017 [Trametes cubensis]|uniref:Uncharacterized protein n=1 Tax=Trametes cubensis TaxID=1111947 RepID=A0AAD7TV52_9APHY|nr:hypothetical protein ONZ51_g6017 [Trametes cubensis]
MSWLLRPMYLPPPLLQGFCPLANDFQVLACILSLVVIALCAHTSSHLDYILDYLHLTGTFPYADLEIATGCITIVMNIILLGLEIFFTNNAYLRENLVRGKIITTEVYFNVFDAAMIVLAMFTLSVLHPGHMLGPASAWKTAAAKGDEETQAKIRPRDPQKW